MWVAEWSCVCFYGLAASANLSRAVSLSLSVRLSQCLSVFASVSFIISLSFYSPPPSRLPSSDPLFVFVAFLNARNSPRLCGGISPCCTPPSVSEWAGIQILPPATSSSSFSSTLPYCQRVIRVKPGAPSQVPRLSWRHRFTPHLDLSFIHNHTRAKEYIFLAGIT